MSGNADTLLLVAAALVATAYIGGMMTVVVLGAATAADDTDASDWHGDNTDTDTASDVAAWADTSVGEGADNSAVGDCGAASNGDGVALGWGASDAAKSDAWQISWK